MDKIKRFWRLIGDERFGLIMSGCYITCSIDSAISGRWTSAILFGVLFVVVMTRLDGSTKND